jgi:hypothetical protein
MFLKKNKIITASLESSENHLFLTSLGSGLGDLTGLIDLFNSLDDTDSDSLTHITDSETTKRRIISISFNTHRLGRNHLDDSGITRLNKLRSIFELLTFIKRSVRECSKDLGRPLEMFMKSLVRFHEISIEISSQKFF